MPKRGDLYYAEVAGSETRGREQLERRPLADRIFEPPSLGQFLRQPCFDNTERLVTHCVHCCMNIALAGKQLRPSLCFRQESFYEFACPFAQLWINLGG